ncbi:hypothetical protein JCM10207_001673 [Rhodosporidiobolus poonsookiae]
MARSPRQPSSLDSWVFPLLASLFTVVIASSTADALPITALANATTTAPSSSPFISSGSSTERASATSSLAVDLNGELDDEDSAALDVALQVNATAAASGSLLPAKTGRLLAAAATTSVAVDVDVDVEVDAGDAEVEMTTSRARTTATGSSSTSRRTRSTASSSSSRLTTTRRSSTRTTTTARSTSRDVSVTTTTARRTSSSRAVSTATRSRSTTRERSSTTTEKASASRTTTARHTSSTTSRRKSASKETSTSKARSTAKITSAAKYATSTSTKKTKTSSTSSAEASPTSYGYVNNKQCEKAPSTFSGPSEGFANICTRRYCDAKARRSMVWTKSSGEVTREEVESALGMLNNVGPLWSNYQENILADGKIGQAAYNARLLFEATGDIRALDVVVRIADNILALQNQNTENPVAIWTGDVDPVWPTQEPKEGGLVYAGSEQGLIAGNMVIAAVMILKIPCLWKMVPPAFDGPTVFNSSVTYYDRAMAYIAAGDDTYENYFDIWFLDPTLSVIQPYDQRWWLTGDTRAPGTLMPWNRRMMVMYGYLALAAAHETPAAYNATRTAFCDAVVQKNVADFISDLNQTRSVANGIATFNWDYGALETDGPEESKGIHGYYDIWGSFVSWQRNSALFGLSNYIGQTFVNTFESTISLGNGSFSGLVTGASTTKAYTTDNLWAGWTFYALWDRQWYETVFQANMDTGCQGRSWLCVPLVWTKHALAADDLTFWSGTFSSGLGVVPGTEGTSSAADTATSGASPSLRPFTSGVVNILALAVAVFLLELSS